MHIWLFRIINIAYKKSLNQFLAMPNNKLFFKEQVNIYRNPLHNVCRQQNYALILDSNRFPATISDPYLY